MPVELDVAATGEINRLRLGNRLLDSLPDALFEPFKGKLAATSLTQGARLIEPYQPVPTVWFITGGMVSMVRRLEDGSSVEVAAIGCGGLVGVSVLLGDETEPTESFVQIAGPALSIRAEALREIITAAPAVRSALLPFVSQLLARMAQSAACNARHSSDQRLARWLLTASDEVGSLDFALSHESIAIMLGVRRSGVTTGLARMRAAGLIRNGRNRIVIVDKRRLESVSCECYRDPEQQGVRARARAASRQPA
jgi:CRP-like cAMP-binding protein